MLNQAFTTKINTDLLESIIFLDKAEFALLLFRLGFFASIFMRKIVL